MSVRTSARYGRAIGLPKCIGRVACVGNVISNKPGIARCCACRIDKRSDTFGYGVNEPGDLRGTASQLTWSRSGATGAVVTDRACCTSELIGAWLRTGCFGIAGVGRTRVDFCIWDKEDRLRMTKEQPKVKVLKRYKRMSMEYDKSSNKQTDRQARQTSKESSNHSKLPVHPV
jgi:hypothetical protein